MAIHSKTGKDDQDFSTPFLIELRKVFDMFDEDSDGGLCCDELEKVFRQLGLEGDNEHEFRQRVANIVLANDLDGDGKLQWSEFVDLMRRNVNVDYRSIFDQFFDHRDGNGLIDSHELKTILQRLGSDVTEKEIDTMMSTADCDGDGQINFEEFLALLKAKDAQYLLTSDQGIVKVLSTSKSHTDTTNQEITTTISTSTVKMETLETTQSHNSVIYSSMSSSSSISTSQSSSQPGDGVVRSSSLKALLAQIPQLPQQIGSVYAPKPMQKPVNEASLMRLRTLIHSPEFPTAVKPVLTKGRGRPRKIPPGWLHSDGGPPENTQEAWGKLSREKQTEAQNEVKKRLLEKKEAIKKEKEESRKQKKCKTTSSSLKHSRSYDDEDDEESKKRRKLAQDAEALAAAQVARWEEEDALVDKLLSTQDEYQEDDQDQFSDDDVDSVVSEEDLLSRVPSLAEEKAECELLSKVLAGFNEEDHLLLETMVTKARDIDGGDDFQSLSNFTVQSHWDDVEAHRAAAQKWFTLVIRAQVMSAVWNSGSHLPTSSYPPRPLAPPAPLLSKDTPSNEMSI